MSPVSYLADWRVPDAAARAGIVQRFGGSDYVRGFVDAWADAGASDRKIVAALESRQTIVATSEAEARAQLALIWGEDEAARAIFIGETQGEEK